MNKINTQEMRKVADFFDEMYKKGGKISMGKTYSDAEINNCGTPACIGGWMAVYYDTKMAVTIEGERCFDDGVEIFAKKLGFEGMEELEEWAEDNKKLWGEHGIEMFYQEYAWIEKGGYDDKGKLTLEQAAYKLRKVVGRVNEYQEQKK